MKLKGLSIIGWKSVGTQGPVFRAANPATGSSLEPAYKSATAHDVDSAARLAHHAFLEYECSSGAQRAGFLREIAVQLETDAEAIVQRASEETALPVPRLQSEMGRTCFQLRLFADLVQEGSWVDARIDHGDPSRQPVSKPDVRSMLRPLGPVTVFGSSNFPLAFSVAGGDTASALAAGCPVIVKAHPAHPGTSERVGAAILKAARHTQMPEGIFSLLVDAGFEVAKELVRHPLIKAVGFTGSLQGGLSLLEIAASRPQPIPVFAEMGSVNPVILLPGAVQTRGREIAEGLHASVTLGVGQFCTNPGLIFMEKGDDTDQFLAELERLMENTLPGTMLTEAIASAYRNGVQGFSAIPGVQVRVAIPSNGTASGAPALLTTEGSVFLSRRELMSEIFGPVTLVVLCAGRQELRSAVGQLEGQLTATLHATDKDLLSCGDMVKQLEAVAGRLVFNGFPTGVEVGHAMVHGGPYPATSDGRSTSVGTRAIERFTRPVCYQNCPETLLPAELQESNPRGIRRLVDGKWAP
jgi:NADP-dependent aldehyde dehydrogenase